MKVTVKVEDPDQMYFATRCLKTFIKEGYTSMCAFYNKEEGLMGSVALTKRGNYTVNVHKHKFRQDGRGPG